MCRLSRTRPTSCREPKEPYQAKSGRREPAITTPLSSRRSSGGSGRAPKKSAGRKPTVKLATLALPSLVAPAVVDLQAALGSAGTAAKARRSRASPVPQRAPSARAKAVLGDLSSLESPQLLGNVVISKKFLRTCKIMVVYSNERGECWLRTLVDRKRKR